MVRGSFPWWATVESKFEAIMAKFAVAIAAATLLASAGTTVAAGIDGATMASVDSRADPGGLVTVAAVTGRGMGSQGGEAGSGGGARHGGGGGRGGEAGSHGNRPHSQHDGDHGRHHGHHGQRHGHDGGYHHGSRFYHGPRFGFGLAFGAPWAWGGGYYPYPYYPPYYYGSGYSVYAEPVLIRYVERDPGYRYYCTEPAGFYPDVQSCPKVWLKVLPEGAASTSPPPGYSAPPVRQ